MSGIIADEITVILITDSKRAGSYNYFMAREHEHNPQIIALSQSERERRMVWERSDVTVLDEDAVNSQVSEKKFYVLPKGTVAMLRIGYAMTPVEMPKYFDLGETALDSDTHAALIPSKIPVPSEVGRVLTFTLDSHDRRALYESGQGRAALEVEKSLAREFMAKRRNTLSTEQFDLRLGMIVQIQLVTKSSNPEE